MRAVLRDNKHVYLDTISDAESQILWEAFTFEDPNAYRTTSTARSWQGKYRKFDRINKRVVRTFLGRLAFQCRKHDLPFHVEDQRPKWKYTYIDEKLVDKDFLPGITLEDYQIAAIKKGIKCECGIFKLTTGAGKTEIIAGMCKAINCPTLILADMTVVVSQLRDRLKLREVASEIGMFFAGEKPNGEQIVIGSIQSLNPPKPPKDEPEEGSYKNEKTFKQAHKRWESSLLAYETRKRNYKMLMEYVKNAEMIIVDECDRSNSSTYKQVIRKIFTGRRRYGFCLSGETKIQTPDGIRKLSEFSDGNMVTLLSDGGTYQNGTVIETGDRESFEVILSNGQKISGSENHFLADDVGDYIRIGDIFPGQSIQIQNDAFINDFESLSDIFSIIDSSSDFSNISWHGLEFSRPNFEKKIIGTEINDIFSGPVELVVDPRALSFKENVVDIHELHEQELIGGRIIKSLSTSRDVISGLEFGRTFNPTASISFGQCLTNFLPDDGIISGVASEFFDKNFVSILDRYGSHEGNGKSVSFYHGSLNSVDDFICFHRIVNSISLDTSSSPFGLVIERLASIPFKIDSPSFFLVLLDGKPVFYSMVIDHFLFVGFKSSISSVDNMRKFLNTFFAEMSTEIPDMIRRLVCIAFKNVLTIVTRYSDDIMIPNLTLISDPTDYHDFSSLNGIAKPFYVCSDSSSVQSIEKIGSEKMYDIVDVTNTSNFYANGILTHNSATPFDDEKPISNLNVEENFGYIIFEMQRKEIEARGRIIPLKYRMMVYEDPQFDLHNKIALDEATNLFMVENQRFHDLILAIVQFHAGEKNMILVDRIPLGENLLESARARGMTAGFIYGKTPKRERTEFIDRFAAGDLDVLIGGKIVNRGLDVKGGVDNLIMAAGGKLRSDFLQKIGRALRVNNRGFSYVYDVLFRCNHYLYEHGKARLKTIVDAEYDSAVNFGHDTIDGPTLIKRNFRPPTKPKAGQRRIEEKTLFDEIP